MDYDVIVSLSNRVEEYELKSIAKQANGSAWLKCGGAVILATVVIDETAVVEEGFLPLTVQYIQKSYAAGKIPGGFIKRESKPSDFEALTSRLVDRSLRPIFPKGFANPIQITILVLSCDEDSDLQTLALSAASAALYNSDIDINESVAALRIAKIDDQIVLNPTLRELKSSTLDICIAGTSKDLLMIEMRSIGGMVLDSTQSMALDPMMSASAVRYSSNAIKEDEFIEILKEAQLYLQEANSAYIKAFAPTKKETLKLVCLNDKPSEKLVEFIQTEHIDQIKDAIKTMAVSERSTALRSLRKTILQTQEFDELELKRAIEHVKKSVVRSQILKSGIRADGRGVDEIRDIDILTNVLPNAHSSCLFTRGQTQALVALTLGNNKDAQMYEELTDSSAQYESFMVHYNFPGFSVGEASPVAPPKRRELGHGNLAARALEPILCAPSQTIRLVSEILESNGSSSMATVCAGYMALRAADIETVESVAGVAMGLVCDGDEAVVLSDITGLEDHDGDMDFKVTGSSDAITALQMDIKLGGISLELLSRALYQARDARVHIIKIMEQAQSKIKLSDTLPSSDLFNIDPSRIAEVIGQAGKTIREIIEKFEVAIDIDKKVGSVKLTGASKEKLKGAKEHIQNILNSPAQPKVEYSVGDKVDGIVKRIVDFGAFIELPGGVDGLLHISKISDERISCVADVLSEGSPIRVEILEFKGNKISLGRG